MDTHANLGLNAQIDDLCIDIWISVLTICLSTQITERQGKLANVLPSHCINLQFQVWVKCQVPQKGAIVNRFASRKSLCKVKKEEYCKMEWRRILDKHLEHEVSLVKISTFHYVFERCENTSTIPQLFHI